MNRRLLPLSITILLFVGMAVFGALRYDGFLSPQVFLNLLIDNAFLCVVAVGMTFVILSGGIDLSVGAVIALTTMISAALLDAGWNPYAAMALVLVLGAAFGALQGLLIQQFQLAPFIVTLAGMFLARGCCYLISTESIPIDDPTYSTIAQARIPVGFDSSLTIGAIIALAVVLAAMRIAHSTEFGRTVYAIGGGEPSARLMGLSVASTKVGVYLLSGFCAALGGVVMTFYMLSGYSLHAVGLELDAIAAVVIGGTLLAGGIGSVLGTLVGVLMLGLILTSITTYEGTLSSGMTRVVIGLLLLVFVLLQKLLTRSLRSQPRGH